MDEQRNKDIKPLEDFEEQIDISVIKVEVNNFLWMWLSNTTTLKEADNMAIEITR